MTEPKAETVFLPVYVPEGETKFVEIELTSYAVGDAFMSDVDEWAFDPELDCTPVEDLYE